ncbi:bifunctional ADP-dependent NAD(P)H-hydrate dehydratase/NAD(P)H-hydrate epimerase [Paraburkholderia oxyphila]|uniref:bifunctional ADP-dependent NAD(P)H-hydrate dehydratase/NAD(P)H-hydrate epimerase n=1 Tax=Paraburkholderia oxyphila TaxID=614212 RepID=UPI000486C6A9|nr:bifunctional ADP-dependent NAD(P)H-hydrate dehydratase/NAD(P)H-hydrate epimerase [Paraburkholderia oxyphila]
MTDATFTLPLPMLVNPHDRAVPLLTVAQLREAETAAQAALPEHTLMARAGAGAAHFLREQIAHAPSPVSAKPVWFAAGPGNNGGDALVAAAELKRAGIDVEVCMPLEVKPDDARWALAEARAASVPITTAPPESFDAYGWLVDGLFGIGLARALDGVFGALAQRLAARARSHGHVLALDVPSGLDSDTGNVVGGGPAVRATHTVTFIAAKPGLYTGAGRDYAGAVSVAPIGLDAGLAPDTAPGARTIQPTGIEADPGTHPLADTIAQPARLNAPALFSAALPARDFATNKGSFGTLAVVGGDTGMCGAPILAARAALLAGAGKVHVGFLGSDAPPYDAPHPELMLHTAGKLALETMSAVAAGCGMGGSASARQLVDRILQLDVAVLLDADALNLVARDELLAKRVAEHLSAHGTPCVLTPHPLEAARLLGTDTAAVQRDRLAAARALAARYAAVAVLKGSGTIIAAPDGRVAVNPTGNAALATGGTGDVLGGLIGALLAQRLPPWEAALAGVYLHGLAADTLVSEGDGPVGLAAGELAPVVRRLMNRLFYALKD